MVEATDEFDAYIAQMRWAQHYALLNREEMMDRVVRQFAEWMGLPSAADVRRLEEINCRHNCTERDTQFDEQVWLSRKGAINAEAGRAGLIPGSMGTASYVVTGRGNPLSLHSAPHGAGRAFSRTAARRQFTADDLRTAMTGIEYRDTDAFIDEIPVAYKDIDQVMAAPPTWPRSGTRCVRSSTSRATERLLPGGRQCWVGRSPQRRLAARR